MANLKKFAQVGKKIAGAGMNYNSLLKIQKAEKPKNPVIFLKPSTSYIIEGQPIKIPKGFTLNEEIELGVIIGKRCKNIDAKSIMDYVGGYCLALDMTATSELGPARAQGLPWCIGKGFDTACPVSPFIAPADLPDAPNNITIWCKVNGVEKQRANTSDLTFDIPTLVSFVNRYMTLEPGDLILTGSPPGMGPVNAGDVIDAGIDGGITIKFTVENE